VNACASFNFKFYIIRFEYVKDFYNNDIDFSQVYKPCENSIFDKFYRFDGYLLKKKILCVHNYSMCELLIREVHKGGLMRYFRVAKTSDVLHEHFYWPKMKGICKEFMIGS